MKETYNASNYRYRDLHYLVARGDIENVRLYLRLGGDVNLGGGSKSALILLYLVEIMKWQRFF